jgi:tryptophan 2,3-dioxygenase
MNENESAAVTYGSYLQVDQLLELQKPRSDEHDEILFIVIHQVYELWFREMLHELDRVMQLLRDGNGAKAQHTLKRILTILKVLVAQVDILETMTPLEFLTFRNRLAAASGFQSDQFRQLEFVMGNKSRGAIERFGEGTRARKGLEARWSAPTLWDAFLLYLKTEGYPVPEQQLARDITAAVEPSPEIQQILIDLYRKDPRNSELCERLVDLDEGMQEWRYRHVKMVERTIGAKPGSGGSSGAQYLRSTVGRNLFPDLWEIRGSL